MGNDIFKDIFDNIDRSIGNFKYKNNQKITIDKINVFDNRKHIIESMKSEVKSEVKGEIVKIDYYIVKKADGVVEVIKAPDSLKRELQIIQDNNDCMRWRILNIANIPDKHDINRNFLCKKNHLLFFIPELDIENKLIYQFIFGGFNDFSFTLYNVNNFDKFYNNKNHLKEKHFEMNQYFSKSFEDFIKAFNEINESSKKYYIISTVKYSTMMDLFLKKECKNDKDLFIKNRMLSIIENAENWVSIIDLFTGWYYKAENPISFSSEQFKDPIEYMNYLSRRSALIQYKKTKNINLNFLKNIIKKYYFIEKTDNKYDKNKDFDLFEKVSIVYNLFLILLYKKGGFAE